MRQPRFIDVVLPLHSLMVLSDTTFLYVCCSCVFVFLFFSCFVLCTLCFVFLVLCLSLFCACSVLFF